MSEEATAPLDETVKWLHDVQNRMRNLMLGEARRALWAVDDKLLVNLLRRVRNEKVKDRELVAMILSEAIRRLDDTEVVDEEAPA